MLEVQQSQLDTASRKLGMNIRMRTMARIIGRMLLIAHVAIYCVESPSTIIRSKFSEFESQYRYTTAVSKRSDIRRLAMQALYQIDMRGEGDLALIREAVHEDVNDPGLAEEVFTLATGAWKTRKEADAKATALAPDWPTHRQPPVDRAILRLAYFEMISGHAPIKVAINEAVELAKSFCAENSPSFLNGVLDKMARDVKPPAQEGEAAESDEPPYQSPKAWLEDAMND